ncbi:hypothetical protein BDN71DRAFT_3296 [Pleurotus eryngii]|uniref:Uncharacterized protein n=1 Tax=Pleurotus eryngii TaxID=5323 RepID=A0A9P6DKK8_PLEER|nr:hypothetical protein BDN71DRAFT_3296 [Pleurotus eryngii]
MWLAKRTKAFTTTYTLCFRGAFAEMTVIRRYSITRSPPNGRRMPPLPPHGSLTYSPSPVPPLCPDRIDPRWLRDRRRRRQNVQCRYISTFKLNDMLVRPEVMAVSTPFTYNPLSSTGGGWFPSQRLLRSQTHWIRCHCAWA